MNTEERINLLQIEYLNLVSLLRASGVDMIELHQQASLVNDLIYSLQGHIEETEMERKVNV